MLTRISPASGFFCRTKPNSRNTSRSHTPLLSLESQRPLTDFAAVAFSLSFEPDYLNVLKILELARIPLLAADRGEHFPAIVAGGVAAMLNPEPLAPFLDAFFLGEGDAHAAEFFGILTGPPGPPAALKTLVQKLPGVYIPAAYQPEYHPDGTLQPRHRCSRFSGKNPAAAPPGPGNLSRPEPLAGPRGANSAACSSWRSTAAAAGAAVFAPPALFIGPSGTAPWPPCRTSLQAAPDYRRQNRSGRHCRLRSSRA